MPDLRYPDCATVCCNIVHRTCGGQRSEILSRSIEANKRTYKR